MAPLHEPGAAGPANANRSSFPSFAKEVRDDSADRLRFFGMSAVYGSDAMTPPRRSNSRTRHEGYQQRSPPLHPCATPRSASPGSGSIGRREQYSVREEGSSVSSGPGSRDRPRSNDVSTSERRRSKEYAASRTRIQELLSETEKDPPFDGLGVGTEDEHDVREMVKRQAEDHERQLQELRVQREEAERTRLEQEQHWRMEDKELRRTQAHQAQEQRRRQEEELRQARAQRLHEEEKLRRLQQQREQEISQRRSEKSRHTGEVQHEETRRNPGDQREEERGHVQGEARRYHDERTEANHDERRRQTREHANSMLEENLRRREDKELKRLEAQREEAGDDELRRLQAQRDQDLMLQQAKDAERQRLHAQREQDLLQQQQEEAHLIAEEQRCRLELEKEENEMRSLKAQREEELLRQQVRETHALAEEQRRSLQARQEQEYLQQRAEEAQLNLQQQARQEQEYLQQQAEEAQLLLEQQFLLEQQQREQEQEELRRLQAQQEQVHWQRLQEEEDARVRAQEEQLRQEQERVRQEQEIVHQASEMERQRLEMARLSALAEEERTRRAKESVNPGPEASANAGTSAPNRRAADPGDKGDAGETRRSSASLAAASLYEVLEIEHNAAEEVVRKAYKKQCMKHHPDKGGDRDWFDRIQQAYQVLSDPRLRKAYNKGGLPGVEATKEREQRSQQHAQAEKRHSQKQHQAQAIVAEALVPLEVAFTGGSVEVQVVRIVSCQRCNSTGVEPGGGHVMCPGCEAQGEQIQYIQFGEMVLEQRVPCGHCGGAGSVLPFEYICTGCGGEQLVEEEAVVLFEIPPGLSQKERLVQRGKGHMMPGLSTGDVVLVCRVQEHERFLRKGDDLLAEQLVPLQLALCGGALVTPHLGGRSVNLRLPRGAVVAPGAIKCVPGEGMPKRHNPHLRGDLVLRFAVEFPVSLPEEVAARLETAFTGHLHEQAEAPPTPVVDQSEVYLADFNMEEFGNTLQQAAREVHDSEDDEIGGDQESTAGMTRRTGPPQFHHQPHPFIFSPYAAGHGAHPTDYGHAGQACQQM